MSRVTGTQYFVGLARLSTNTEVDSACYICAASAVVIQRNVEEDGRTKQAGFICILVHPNKRSEIKITRCHAMYLTKRQLVVRGKEVRDKDVGPLHQLCAGQPARSCRRGALEYVVLLSLGKNMALRAGHRRSARSVKGSRAIAGVAGPEYPLSSQVVWVQCPEGIS
jgi:hypothetical protein